MMARSTSSIRVAWIPRSTSIACVVARPSASTSSRARRALGRTTSAPPNGNAIVAKGALLGALSFCATDASARFLRVFLLNWRWCIDAVRDDGPPSTRRNGHPPGRTRAGNLRTRMVQAEQAHAAGRREDPDDAQRAGE